VLAFQPAPLSGRYAQGGIWMPDTSRLPNPVDSYDVQFEFHCASVHHLVYSWQSVHAAIKLYDTTLQKHSLSEPR